MTILWWHWVAFGLVLAVAELATAGGFFIIFFGVSALIVGVSAALGAVDALWLQVLLFSILSVILLLVFRSRLLDQLQRNSGAAVVDELVGEIGTASEDLPALGIGRIELRGTPWSARNRAQTLVPRGSRCRVVRVEGLLLEVEPEKMNP